MAVIDAAGVQHFDHKHCEQCLRSASSAGVTSYFHNVLEAKLVSSNGMAVSLVSEWIANDAEAPYDKQDCELKASKRLVAKMRVLFPSLPIVIAADGLYPNEPFMQLCHDRECNFILTLKDGNLPDLQEEIALQTAGNLHHAKQARCSLLCPPEPQYRWINNLFHNDITIHPKKNICLLSPNCLHGQVAISLSLPFLMPFILFPWLLAELLGKTTILEELQKNIEGKLLFLNADEPDVRERLTNVTSSQLKQLIGEHKAVVIDEAQRIKNIGLTLKLIADQIKQVQVIATGSSAFELANEINEPLTGRKHDYNLFPISVKEMIEHHGETEEKRMLETRLIYGMYPEVVTSPGKEKKVLESLSGSYLYKDIFSFQEIRRPEAVEKLLQALALQVCHEVSYNELAQIISADPITVE
ncbi:MAG: hypothetical protein CRN43_21380, partial [Candidatus Nephrothrix sp. EaCA]